MKYPKKGLGTIWPDDPTDKPVTAYFVPPQTAKYDYEWLNLWQNVETGVSMTEQAYMEKPLTQTEYRVRDVLIGTIGIGNYVYVNQAEMARKLRVTKANVCLAIKRLIDLGILCQGPKSGKNNTYMISPSFCFKGTLDQGQITLNKAIKKYKTKILPFQQQNILDKE